MGVAPSTSESAPSRGGGNPQGAANTSAQSLPELSVDAAPPLSLFPAPPPSAVPSAAVDNELYADHRTEPSGGEGDASTSSAHDVILNDSLAFLVEGDNAEAAATSSQALLIQGSASSMFPKRRQRPPNFPPFVPFISHYVDAESFPDPELRRTLRLSLAATTWLMLLQLAVNVSGIVTIIASIQKTYRDLGIVTFLNSRYLLQLVVSIGHLFLAPPLLFFAVHYTLYSGWLYYRRTSPPSSGEHAELTGSFANRMATVAVSSVRKLFGWLPPAAGVNGAASLHGLHTSGVLLAAISHVSTVVMYHWTLWVFIVGLQPWGGSGIVVMLDVASHVQRLQQRAGRLVHSAPPTLDIVSVAIVSAIVSTVQLVVVTLLLVRVGWHFWRSSKYRGLGSFALLLWVAITALVLTWMFTVGGSFNDVLNGGGRTSGGATPGGTSGTITPEGGKRGLCFRNSCQAAIRVSQIGGATGIECLPWQSPSTCPAGTVCNPGNQQCHFAVVLSSAAGNDGLGLFLGPGGYDCVPFDYPPVAAQIKVPSKGTVSVLTQWSGAIYASTGCRPNGQCSTAICNNCPPYEGPVGPVTQAEMTLLVDDKDYYDVTIINGANLPMSVTPASSQNASTAFFPPDPNSNPAYHCWSPGAARSGDASSVATVASWSFQAPTLQGGGSGASQYRLVGDGSLTACPCTVPGEVCGVAMMLNRQGLPLDSVQANVCGKLLGIWSDDELCAWTDAISYGDCDATVPGSPTGGNFKEMFQCNAPFDVSCFQQNPGSSCCGCTVWPALNLPVTMACQDVSPVWMAQAYPRLLFLKAACPTCYTYPFDDSTSLFTCRGANVSGPSVSAGSSVGASYDIEWCPGGVEITAP